MAACCRTVSEDFHVDSLPGLDGESGAMSIVSPFFMRIKENLNLLAADNAMLS
jgi:hypothetical protein